MSEYFLENNEGLFTLQANNPEEIITSPLMYIPAKYFRYICYVDIVPSMMLSPSLKLHDDSYRLSLMEHLIEPDTPLLEGQDDYLTYIKSKASVGHNDFVVLLYFKKQENDDGVVEFAVMPVQFNIKDRTIEDKYDLNDPLTYMTFVSGDSNQSFKIPLIYLIELVNNGRALADEPLQKTIKELKKEFNVGWLFQFHEILSWDRISTEYTNNIIPQLLEPSTYTITARKEIKRKENTSLYSLIARAYSSSDVDKVGNFKIVDDAKHPVTGENLKVRYTEPLDMPEIYRLMKVLNSVEYPNDFNKDRSILVGDQRKWGKKGSHIGRDIKYLARSVDREQYVYGRTLSEWVYLFSKDASLDHYSFHQYILPFIDAVVQGGEGTVSETENLKIVDEDIELFSSDTEKLLFRVPAIHEVLFFMQLIFNKNYYDKDTVLFSSNGEKYTEALPHKVRNDQDVLFVKRDALRKYKGYPDRLPAANKTEDPEFNKYYERMGTVQYINYYNKIYEHNVLYKLFRKRNGLSVFLDEKNRTNDKAIKLMYNFFSTHLHLILNDYASDNDDGENLLMESGTFLCSALDCHEVLFGMFMGAINALHRCYAKLFRVRLYAKYGFVDNKGNKKELKPYRDGVEKTGKSYELYKVEREIKRYLKCCGVILSIVIDIFPSQYKKDIVERKSPTRKGYENFIEPLIIYLGESAVSIVTKTGRTQIKKHVFKNNKALNDDVINIMLEGAEEYLPEDMKAGFGELEKEMERIRKLALDKIFGKFNSVVTGANVKLAKQDIAYSFRIFIKELGYGPFGDNSRHLFMGNAEHNRREHYLEFKNSLNSGLGLALETI
ncbi:MAG: hypothetical protein WBH03_11065 [Cyclobacteriaceae bacterium]